MTIDRPRQFDENRSLDNAMMHFLQRGYTLTSMGDLTCCTGLSKSSLCKSFGNKSTQFIKCLSRFKRNLVSQLEEQPSKSLFGLQFIRDVLDMLIAEANNSQRISYMLINSANELPGQYANFASGVVRGFSQLQTIFAKALKMAKHDHEVSDEIDVESMEVFYFDECYCLRIMVKSGVNHVRLKRIANRTLAALN